MLWSSWYEAEMKICKCCDNVHGLRQVKLARLGTETYYSFTTISRSNRYDLIWAIFSIQICITSLLHSASASLSRLTHILIFAPLSVVRALNLTPLAPLFHFVSVKYIILFSGVPQSRPRILSCTKSAFGLDNRYNDSKIHGFKRFMYRVVSLQNV